MYLVPQSEIKIGNMRFFGGNTGINAVEIDTSVKKLVSTAKITLPANFKNSEGKKITELMHVGDKAEIRLGYNGKLETEFTGYVNRISATTPLVVELENAWFAYKRKPPLNKNWKNTSLREILAFAFPGLEIECPDVNLTNYLIKQATPYEIANRIQGELGFCTHIDEEKQKLLCFLPYEYSEYRTHTYVFGTRKPEGLEELKRRRLSPNIAKNSLEFTSRDDLKLQVTGKTKDAAGKSIQYTHGSTDENATKRTRNYGSDVTTMEDLKVRTIADYDKWNFDGFTGKITGFGTPAVRAGDCLQLVDVDHPEREGKYLVEAVKITYGIKGGFRRENTLSYRI